MKLITEEINKVEFITEGKGTSKKCYIQGIFLQAEQVNRNGRMYPMAIMEREVNRYNENFVMKGRALGELGHPDGPTVNLDRVSHKICDLRREGNNFIGKAKILGTPNGNIVKAFIDGGCSLGVSSRGLGSLQEKGGISVVQPDYKLMAAADIVADPSAQEAFVEAVMESKEWIWDNGRVKEVTIDSYKKRLEKSKSLQEEKIAVFKDFLSRL